MQSNNAVLWCNLCESVSAHHTKAEPKHAFKNKHAMF